MFSVFRVSKFGHFRKKLEETLKQFRERASELVALDASSSPAIVKARVVCDLQLLWCRNDAAAQGGICWPKQKK
jgi:hypothetical protein